MIINIITWTLLVMAVVYAFFISRNVYLHKEELMQEPGKVVFLAPLTMGIQFLATMGMSDFNISIPIYRWAKLVDDKRIPGTLITQGALPGAFISIAHVNHA